jgi:hypothetical protein
MRIIIALFSLVSLGMLFASIDYSRDPFKPVSYSSLLTEEVGLASDKIERVILTGIIWDKDNPFAIISAEGLRHIVQIGDLVGTYTVEKIDLHNVTLKLENKTLILEEGKVSKLR